MATETGCDHPDQDLTVTPHNSMYDGAEAYCAACGGQWHMTQQEVEAHANP